MNCDELANLLPDLVDGTLSEEQRAEAEATLPLCPECQRELEIARQVRAFMVRLQAEYANVHIPAGFEARLLAKVRAHHSGSELLDLSSVAFVVWLIEFLNLLGGLIDPGARNQQSGTAL
jgi:anti-sigma factor RsiW